MKKLLKLMVLFLAIFAAVGCSEEDKTKVLDEYLEKIEIQASVSEDFTLPRLINELGDHSITWESSDSSTINVGSLIDTTKYNAQVVQKDTDVEVTLTAILELSTGETKEKTFVVVVVKKEAAETPVEDVSVQNAKSAAADLALTVKGTVTTIGQNGYMLSDTTGTIFVYTKTAPNVAVGNVVTAKGTKSIYYNMPQLAQTEVVVDSATSTFSYSTVSKTYQEISETAATTTAFYGTYIKALGVLEAGDDYTPYKLLVDGTDNYLLINKYTSTTALSELASSVGMTVEIDIVAYDTYDGEWRFFYQEGTLVNKGSTPVEVKKYSVSDARELADDTDVMISGAVVYVATNGFIVTDETGNIFVYTKTEPEVVLNSEVSVEGTKASYNNMPQISPTKIDKTADSTAISVSFTGLEYDAIKDIASTTKSMYTVAASISGIVVEGDSYTPYKLQIVGTENYFLIVKGTPTTALSELASKVGSYVNVNAFVYDNYNSEWRFLYVEGSLEEEQAPEVTNEQKFAYAKDILEGMFLTKIKENITLPVTLEKYDLTITWESNSSCISNTGVYTALENDTEVKLTATVKLNDVALGTVEITVVAKGFKESTDKGEAYSHTFKKDDLGASGTKNAVVSLSNLSWSFTHDSATGYLGWDSNSGRQLQIGSSNSPSASIVFETDFYEGVVETISISTCGASKIANTKINVYVNGELVGSDDITKTITSFSYTANKAGTIKIEILGANVAVYVQSISIN